MMIKEQMFNGKPSRTVVIDGKMWWIAADVFEIIGVKYFNAAIKRLDDSQKSIRIFPDTEEWEWDIISIEGIKALVKKSRSKVAREFQDWAFDLEYKTNVEENTDAEAASFREAEKEAEEVEVKTEVATDESITYIAPTFNGRPSRTVMINGETWWIAKDVCNIIGIKYHRAAVRKLNDTQKDVYLMPSPVGEISIINMQGIEA